MRKFSVLVLTCCVLFMNVHAQQFQNAISKDTIVKGKYTLVFVNSSADFDPVTKKKMIDAFFTVYPLEAQRFNKKTLTHVTFWIDPSYNGVAETGNGLARYNPAWLKSHPEDIDVVTHEVMHIVQDYRGEGPGWLTEGIADYARYVFGVNNVKGDWKLPEYKERQSYTNAYRVTARFLLWVEKNKDKKIVDEMDSAMRAGTYKPDLWIKLTGKSVDDLWKEYSGKPDMQLAYK